MRVAHSTVLARAADRKATPARRTIGARRGRCRARCPGWARSRLRRPPGVFRGWKSRERQVDRAPDLERLLAGEEDHGVLGVDALDRSRRRRRRWARRGRRKSPPASPSPARPWPARRRGRRASSSLALGLGCARILSLDAGTAGRRALTCGKIQAAVERFRLALPPHAATNHRRRSPSTGAEPAMTTRIENRTFKELAVGDGDSYAHALTPQDFERFAARRQRARSPRSNPGWRRPMASRRSPAPAAGAARWSPR